jgi:prepilin-type N-terminal cleavage/methylation domain-containing protein
MSPSASGLPWRRDCCKAGRKRIDPEGNGGQEGFTLIELLVVIVIIPLVVGAISVALISVLMQQNTVQNALGDSSDAQLVSATFVKDVQSASFITTNPTPPNASSTTPPVCGPNTPFLSLEWSSTPTVVVSYAVAPRGSAAQLVRQFCQYTDITPGTNPPTWSGPMNPSSHVIAGDVQTSLSQALQISGESCNNGFTCDTSASNAAANGWAATQGVSGVQMTVQPQVHSDQSFQYSLSGVPRVSNSASSGQNPGGTPPLLLLGTGNPDVSCGGNGTMNVESGPADFDSTSNPVASTGGNGSINVQSGQVTTNASSASGALTGNNMTPKTPTQTGTFTPDPFSGLTPPVSGLPLPGGTHQVTMFNGQPLSVFNNGGGNNYEGPGVYTQTLSFTTSTTLASGVYVLENGLSITGNGTIDGSAGVLIYNWGNTTQGLGGAISIAGTTKVTLAPLNPALWPNTNLVIWQDAGNTQGLNLAGSGGITDITGTIYAPNASVGATGSGKGGAITASSIVAAGISPCQGKGTITITG